MCTQEVFVMPSILKHTPSPLDKPDRDRSGYQKAYYEKNRDKLSEERKRRYREDPEYRDTMLAQVRAYRIKKRRERERLRKEGKIAPAHPGGPRAPLRVTVGGVSTIAYTVGRVAIEIRRSKDVINYWTRIGLLPQTPFRSPRGDRLYTEGMVLVMQVAIGKRSRVASDDREFTHEIRSGWEGIGVTVPR